MKKIFFKIYKTTFTIIKKPINVIREFIFSDLRTVFKNYTEHDGELSTCAIAFFLLISFIPTSLVIISILSFFYKSDAMAAFYLKQLKSQLPTFNIQDIISQIDKIIYSKRYLAFIWIPFLFWWGSLVFDILERALEKAFRVEESRIYWKAKIRHFTIIVAMGLFVLMLTFVSNFLAILRNSDIVEFIGKNLTNISIIHDIILYLTNIPMLLTSATTLFINTLLIFNIYKFVPPKKLDNMSLFRGALFASFSYEVIKIIFSYYITVINDYTSIFGSLSTIVILMIWIWYTCFLFVIGAEMSWVFFEKKVGARTFDFSESIID